MAGAGAVEEAGQECGACIHGSHKEANCDIRDVYSSHGRETRKLPVPWLRNITHRTPATDIPSLDARMYSIWTLKAMSKITGNRQTTGRFACARPMKNPRSFHPCPTWPFLVSSPPLVGFGGNSRWSIFPWIFCRALCQSCCGATRKMMGKETVYTKGLLTICDNSGFFPSSLCGLHSFLFYWTHDKCFVKRKDGRNRCCCRSMSTKSLISPFKRWRFQKKYCLHLILPVRVCSPPGIHPKRRCSRGVGWFAKSSIPMQLGSVPFFKPPALAPGFRRLGFSVIIWHLEQHEAEPWLLDGLIKQNPSPFPWGLQHSDSDGRSHIML